MKQTEPVIHSDPHRELTAVLPFVSMLPPTMAVLIGTALIKVPSSFSEP